MTIDKTDFVLDASEYLARAIDKGTEMDDIIEPNTDATSLILKLGDLIPYFQFMRENPDLEYDAEKLEIINAFVKGCHIVLEDVIAPYNKELFSFLIKASNKA